MPEKCLTISVVCVSLCSADSCLQTRKQRCRRGIGRTGGHPDVAFQGGRTQEGRYGTPQVLSNGPLIGGRFEWYRCQWDISQDAV